jgi:hypothetical protein
MRLAASAWLYSSTCSTERSSCEFGNGSFPRTVLAWVIRQEGDSAGIWLAGRVWGGSCVSEGLGAFVSKLASAPYQY